MYITHVAFAACDYIGRHCSASSDKDFSQRLSLALVLAFALKTDRLRAIIKLSNVSCKAHLKDQRELQVIVEGAC